MNNITFIEKTMLSHIECEEYFPLRVVFDSVIGNNRFVGFYHGTENLLEFAVDRESGIVKKMQIVNCKNYEIFDREYSILTVEKNGSIAISYPQHNDCEIFELQVYTNCVLLKLSSKSVSNCYAVGQVEFGIDCYGQLATILIADCDEQTISHIIYELKS
ncbi:MAG: hypothetical protein HUJ53_09275 [Holdemanella sp.]|nr:hypothetical protein [Holdemanella sp.]